MPGWIVQGVRGEGKGLAAVWMMKKYLERGCPVATNMDIYVDKLVKPGNNSVVYRLPDFPRPDDFDLLPPAYDVKYKGEDKNGLIVLDELALWMNSRTFKDKQRLAIIGWLILSRKHHWDLLLTVQSYEMIDAQIRQTLCDFLVQASRTDRQKIPLFGSFLSFLGFSPYRVQHHVYYVYYGMSLNQDPQDKWSFSGKDVYEGYDTNQRLSLDQLVIKGKSVEDVKVVDFRATYTYLPASYLSGQHYINQHQVYIDNAQRLADSIKQKRLKQIYFIKNPKSKQISVKSKTANNSVKDKIMSVVKDSSRFTPKMILLSLGLVAFVFYRVVISPPEMLVASPNGQDSLSSSKSSTEPNLFSSVSDSSITKDPQDDYHKLETSFLDQLLTEYKPRLNGVFKTSKGMDVMISFYDEDMQIVETLRKAQLHDLGATVIIKDYGVFLRTAENMQLITSWTVPFSPAAPVSGSFANLAESKTESISLSNLL